MFLQFKSLEQTASSLFIAESVPVFQRAELKIGSMMKLFKATVSLKENIRM
jgi:hypothetical protein